ncbi:MAG TPA: 2-oxoacid:ferredoxin oxidoreductase subunit beta [Geobacteraceae bacterium]|nr:2-oxoacid:ferredoxin oxidoreductase subunit beta [Geobacteraceae bacterium]
MVCIEDFGRFETAWCPGCGNFAILEAMKKALVASGLAPRDVLFVSGIGQAAKAPHYLNANVFNGLHGRALPAATGAKLANPRLTVIAESGDGCTYGEGGNHFLAAVRRNINVTLVVHDNQVYGLTKGQASPTSDEGFVTKTQPHGVFSAPFNPVAVAVAMHAGFVARGFSGEIEALAGLIAQGIAHPGFALVDVLQPCVSFNKVNTFNWYRKRCAPLPPEYDPTDWDAAVNTAAEWGERIPVGVIYRNDRPCFESHFPVLDTRPPAYGSVDRDALREIIKAMG